MSEPFQPASVTEPVAGSPVPWRRLDPRMLLVHPVLELIRFFPVVVGAFVLGGSGGNNVWQLLGIAIPIVVGVVRFLTTSFRITATQVELKRGLLSRKVLTAPLDRVRAVELTSSPIHRVLGLARIEIGTASAARQSEERFSLDSLAVAQARNLRAALLHRADPSPEVTRDHEADPTTDPTTDPTSSPATGPATDPATRASDLTVGTGAPAAEDEVLLRLETGWVRYAPLTSSGNVIAAALLAGVGQFGERLGADVLNGGLVQQVIALSLVVVVPVLVLTFLVLGAAFAVLGYLVTNWGFTLSRDALGRSFHIRRGLLTTTETSLERVRVRGLEVSEPLGLRLAGAARLAAVVTGVSRGEGGSTQLVPPAPREVVDGVGAGVLGDAEPLQAALRRHGPAARRRRLNRALLAGATPAVLVVIASLTIGASWWLLVPALLLLPPSVWLAEDRYRRLGHALSGGYLVVRSGTLRGQRTVLQRDGIIGWNLEQSWFQRRVGLATLVATTAAGQQAYAAYDVPESEAVALADAAVPGLLTPFLVRAPDSPF